MRVLFALLLTLACALPATATEPPVVSVTVAGDSVILTVAIADNATPQPVSVDSVSVTADIGSFTDVNARVAKAAGVTTARLAWAKANWAPNETRGSTIRVKLGRVAAGCAGGVCWSAETTGPSWSYTLDAAAPDAPEAGAISVQSVELN